DFFPPNSFRHHARFLFCSRSSSPLNIRWMYSLARFVSSPPQFGHVTGQRTRPFTVSSSKVNFEPQGHPTVISISANSSSCHLPPRETDERKHKPRQEKPVEPIAAWKVTILEALRRTRTTRLSEYD